VPVRAQLTVWEHQNNALPQRWTGHCNKEDEKRLHLFLLWCCEKVATFVPTLTTDIPELERRIAEAVASFAGDILTKAWERNGTSD
jgi:hypothetical protein